MASEHGPGGTDHAAGSALESAESKETAGVAVPIPVPEPSDVEDVSWALSTAGASWQRGDPSEALKWLRRAAEAATESSANERAVVIAKAAADLASRLGRESALPPPITQIPAPPPTAPSVVAVTARSGPPGAPPSSPAPKSAPLPASGRPPLPPAIGSQLASQLAAPPPRPGPSGTPPRAAALTNVIHPSKLPLSGPLPQSTLLSKGNEARKGRKSSSNLDREAKSAKALDPAKAPSAARRRRSSRPPPNEITDSPVETLPRPSRSPSMSDAIDAWPTQAMDTGELSTLTEEMIKQSAESGRGAPPASGSAPRPSRPAPPVSRPAPESLSPSQAIRVIVWRTPEGIRVAPAGTPVAAPTVEALLVGLDPGVDLVLWLTRR